MIRLHDVRLANHHGWVETSGVRTFLDVERSMGLPACQWGLST
jgi:hypothetical protein